MKEIKDIVASYIDNAILHEGAIPKVANKAADQITLQFCKLQESNKLEELLYLLDHVNPSVRCWAATHCLHLNEKRSKEVLLELSKNELINASTSFAAKMALKLWNNGTLNGPWKNKSNLK